jgi:plastocyanin
MRAIFAISVAVLLATACGSSTSTSVANSCGTSGAAANVNTPSSSNTFSPTTATITHGETVCWQNSSSVAHTVTADNGDFDVNLPVGNIFLHTYSTPGTYTYHCKIHAAMTGTITVN